MSTGHWMSYRRKMNARGEWWRCGFSVDGRMTYRIVLSSNFAAFVRAGRIPTQSFASNKPATSGWAACTQRSQPLIEANQGPTE